MPARLAVFGALAAAGWAQFPVPATTPSPYPGQTGPQYPRVPQSPLPGAPIPGTQVPNGPPGTRYPGRGQRPPIVIDTNRLPGTHRGNPGPAPSVRISPPRDVSVTEGILRQAEGDHRIISYRLAGDIQITRDDAGASLSDFQPGDHLRVESVSDDQGYYTALRLVWLGAGTAAERAAANETWNLPEAAEREDEKDERPVLRRGPPQPKEEDPEPAPAAAAEPPPARSEPETAAPPDAVIDAARQASSKFTGILPSFAVRQFTARYINDLGRDDWRALDVVAARVVYRAGDETYDQITLDKKPVDTKMEDLDGLRSTGEFSSLLEEVLNPLSGAIFRRAGLDQIRGRRAWKYSYSVPRERSRWRVFTPSEVYYPAYRGALWIDLETSRVLRLEMEATGIPDRFPFDTVETTVDYDFVRLEASKQFLLPVAADALYCVRSTASCRKNHTDFRNYVKFDAESVFIPEPN